MPSPTMPTPTAVTASNAWRRLTTFRTANSATSCAPTNITATKWRPNECDGEDHEKHPRTLPVASHGIVEQERAQHHQEDDERVAAHLGGVAGGEPVDGQHADRNGGGRAVEQSAAEEVGRAQHRVPRPRWAPGGTPNRRVQLTERPEQVVEQRHVRLAAERERRERRQRQRAAPYRDGLVEPHPIGRGDGDDDEARDRDDGGKRPSRSSRRRGSARRDVGGSSAVGVPIASTKGSPGATARCGARACRAPRRVGEPESVRATVARGWSTTSHTRPTMRRRAPLSDADIRDALPARSGRERLRRSVSVPEQQPAPDPGDPLLGDRGRLPGAVVHHA